jgi:hypothetical protein
MPAASQLPSPRNSMNNCGTEVAVAYECAGAMWRGMIDGFICSFADCARWGIVLQRFRPRYCV